MDTITFNKKFGEIFKNDPEMGFMIGNNGNQYLAIFRGDETGEYDEHDGSHELLFYQSTNDRNEFKKILNHGIKFCESI